jgi:hypothetical protein
VSLNKESVKRVIAGPVKIDGGCSRWVELADGSDRVETWVRSKGGWTPGGATIDEFFEARPASVAWMRSLGIPGADMIFTWPSSRGSNAHLAAAWQAALDPDTHDRTRAMIALGAAMAEWEAIWQLRQRAMQVAAAQPFPRPDRPGHTPETLIISELDALRAHRQRVAESSSGCGSRRATRRPKSAPFGRRKIPPPQTACGRRPRSLRCARTSGGH